MKTDINYINGIIFSAHKNLMTRDKLNRMADAADAAEAFAVMKEQGYGKGYEYAHDTEEKLTHMQCMPDSLKDRTYYHPTLEGEERKTAQRLEEIKNFRKE